MAKQKFQPKLVISTPKPASIPPPPKPGYSGTTRDNGKYIRLTELLDIVNGKLPPQRRISRETLLARIRTYGETNSDELKAAGIDLIKQDPSNCPAKSPILVNYDYITKSIPSLMESDVLRDLCEQVQNQAEQLRIVYELLYLKGWLRRDNK